MGSVVKTAVHDRTIDIISEFRTVYQTCSSFPVHTEDADTYQDKLETIWALEDLQSEFDSLRTEQNLPTLSLYKFLQ